MARLTSDSGTITRKPDDTVGSRGSAAVGGGRQTPEQAALTGQGPGGRDDGARKDDWGNGEAGASPPALGGSSGGHSDRQASRGPEAGRKMATGIYRAEQEAGE